MELIKQQCKALPKGTPALSAADCRDFQQQIPDWRIGANNAEISREFRFKNYYETMAFVNAVAWICHQQDHHPDMQISYNRCNITFSTHSVGGLSQNDFICAARIDLLIHDTA